MLSTSIREALTDFHLESYKPEKRPAITHWLFLVSPCPWSLRDLLEVCEGPGTSLDLLLTKTSYDNVVTRLRETAKASLFEGLQRHFVDRRISLNWVDVRPVHPAQAVLGESQILSSAGGHAVYAANLKVFWGLRPLTRTPGD